MQVVDGRSIAMKLHMAGNATTGFLVQENALGAVRTVVAIGSVDKASFNTRCHTVRAAYIAP